MDMRRLVKIVHEAILNPSEHVYIINMFPHSLMHAVESVYIPWDIEEYYYEYVKAGPADRDKNRHRFPCPALGKHNRPLTVVDIKGRIVLWYLPGLLSDRQRVRIQEIKFTRNLI
jgi:hypothetical protein